MELTIYSRKDCHLCEKMLVELEPWRDRYGFSINIVNIDESKSLTDEYAARIPVLYYDEKEICQYFIDEAVLDDFFKSISS